MISDKEIDDLIQDCIDSLSELKIREGAKSLLKLARLWADSGLTLNTFLETREFIICQAEEKSDSQMIRDNLSTEEKALRAERVSQNATQQH